MGDEAILNVMLDGLRRALPVEVTVFTRDEADTLSRHHVEHAVQLRSRSRNETREIVAGLDLFIVGGGGILYDEDAEMFLREVFLAEDVGTPVMVYAVGVGPLRNPTARACVREALNRAAVITVRDSSAGRFLEDLGVQREIVVTTDPAVLLRPEPVSREELIRSEALDPGANLVGFSVREPGPAAPELPFERIHRMIATAADFIVDRFDAEVVFFPLERSNQDIQYSHAVVGQMCHAKRATVLKHEYTPGQSIALLQHFELTVGMRLHFLLFSALAGLPFIALPYAPKVQAFLEELGLSTPSMNEIGIGQLLARIDRAWDDRSSLRARLETGLAELRPRAHLNNELAVRLLSRARRPRRTEPEKFSSGG